MKIASNKRPSAKWNARVTHSPLCYTCIVAPVTQCGKLKCKLYGPIPTTETLISCVTYGKCPQIVAAVE